MDAEAIKELRRRAQAATPGPWGEFGESGKWWVAQTLAGGEPGPSIIPDTGIEMMAQEDVDYIVAVHPAAVLALIAEIERLQAEVLHV